MSWFRVFPVHGPEPDLQAASRVVVTAALLILSIALLIAVIATLFT